MGLFHWANKREENHLNWEGHNPTQAITMKARHAQDLAIKREKKRRKEAKKQKRIQRNNRREY